MKIIFFIESLESGGKERRLVELIKGILKTKNIVPELVLIKNDIFYRELVSLGIKIHIIERKLLKKDPRLFYLFYKICKKIKPQVIHVWGNMPAIYSIPAKLFLSIPMINSEITDSPSNIKFRLLSHKISFPFSDLILSNSQAGIDAYNAPILKSKVIYNGFDFKRIMNLEETSNIKNKLKIRKNIVVGMVATASEKKDYITFINAAIKVLKQIEHVNFICIGAGDFSSIKTYTYSLSNNKKILRNILFLGRQNNVESIMNICDIGVLLTNIDNHGEGISNALLEFMALEKPVIATNHGGNVELISHGNDGFLIKSNNSDDLFSKLTMLISDEKERAKIGIAAKKKITDKFSIKNMISEFLKIYNQYSE